MILRNKDGVELKLFRVTAEIKVYVLAADEDEAKYYGYDGVREGVIADELEADEITADERIEDDWLEALPYGEKAVDENGEEDEFQVRDLLEIIKRLGPDRQKPLPLEMTP